MFIAILTATERVAFAALAHALVHADGRLVEEEAAVLARLGIESGSAVPDPIAMTLDEAIGEIDGDAARRAAMLELMGIGWADGALADAEAVLLDRIADAWGLDSSTRSAMIDWVARQVALVEEASALIGRRA